MLAKPSLQLRLGQQLTLTPQLRQAIRLLQLSSMELEIELNTVLESNPLLERADDAEADAVPEPESAPTEAADAPETPEQQADESLDLPDDRWDEVLPNRRNDFEGGDFADVYGAVTEDLQDHLLWQLNLTPLSERDRAIGVAIIEAIGDDGYLQEPVESIRQTLQPELDLGLDEIEAVLHRIQRFDPLGVGARGLAESLAVQLGQFTPDTPGRALAARLVDGHLEALAKLGPERLARQLDCSAAEMHEAVQLLRSLDPRPGAQIASQNVEYVVPDAYAFRHGGRWHVSLGSSCQPRLAINRHYEGLIARAARDDAAYLRGQLQEARWLIKSLETRADTLLRVAQSIVDRQQGFLEHGAEAMRPLVLREVADELGLHESTVSRVTTRKYLHTPRGTFEFKHFFSTGLATVDGGSASSTAIQAMLRRLIEAEDPRQPLSDARLADELKSQGISVARRTVAKYREAMNIPASNERQRLA